MSTQAEIIQQQQPAGAELAPADVAAWREGAQTWLRKQRSVKTRATYQTAWKDFLERARVHPADVRRLDVIDYRDELEADGLAPATVALRLAALSSFYDFAKSEDLVDRNPVEGVDRPKVKAYHSVEWLSRTAARDLLAEPDCDTLAGKRDSALLWLALTTGLRRAEIVGIYRHDLTGAGDGRFKLRYEPKGGEEDTRTLPRKASDAIREYLEARGNVGAADPVFVAHDNAAGARDTQPITPEALRLIVARYTVAALGKAINPHALRHTAATRLWELTRDPKAVQELLGHSSVAVTERYLHQVEDKRGELGELLAEDLGA